METIMTLTLQFNDLKKLEAVARFYQELHEEKPDGHCVSDSVQKIPKEQPEQFQFNNRPTTFETKPEQTQQPPVTSPTVPENDKDTVQEMTQGELNKQVIDFVKSKGSQVGRTRLKETLDKFEIGRVQDLDKEQYEEFLKELKS